MQTTVIKKDLVSVTNRYNKLINKTANSYIYCDNEIKKLARLSIQRKIEKKFPLGEYKTLKTVTLGGETLPLEKSLIAKGYSLDGLSYETHKETIILAENNKPKGVAIVGDTIMNHTYNGEQLIWFDFMDSLRPYNVNELLNWLGKNQLKSDCIFAVTYTLQSRAKGDGYRQLFGNDEVKINNFIHEMGNYISLYLENENVDVEPMYNVARYKNKNKAFPMVQYIFEVTKK